MRGTLSASELDVLKALWEHGPGTVRDIKDALKRRGRRWAYTTVQTLLTRLQAKECVATDRTGFAHIYSASISREDLVRQGLTDLAENLCDGTAAPLVMALVQGHRFTAEEIEAFRRLLGEAEGAAPSSEGRERRRRS